MARFDDAFKDEVRAQNDIVDVISSYLKLERRGDRYIGLCPFHGEKTPSFNVIPHMQIYHCFGCKATGDVFKFVQEREHMSFFEALVHLAKRARIPLPREERTPEEEKAYRERRALYDALDLAARFFQHQLSTEAGRPAMEYLLSRGLTEATIREFRLGWAPGHGALFRSLANRFSPDIQQKAGLIMPRREGSGYMDAFFERVMFPITDLRGRVIGFGGRILQGNAPKYKNTAETPLFSKRQSLFGISTALETIRTKNQAILVEGYMDVIMPHQVGIKNVVAPLGTALTDEQCKELRRQAEQVIVGFDSDTAGQMATLRGLEKLYDTGCDVRILRLPDGKDPDEFIQAQGVAAFQKCIDEAIPLVEFKIRLAMNKGAGNSPEDKAKALEAVARVLADLKNDLLREEYVHRVANELAASPVDVPELKRAIDRQMNRLLRQGFQHNQPDSRNNMRVSGLSESQPVPAVEGPGRAPTGARPRPGAPQSPVWAAERALLLRLLHDPGLAPRIAGNLGSPAFEDPIHQAIYEAAAPLCAQGFGGSLVAKLLDVLADPENRLVLTEMAAVPLVSADSEKEAADCIEKIMKHRDSRRLDELQNLINLGRASLEELQEYRTLQQKLKPWRKS